MPMFTAAKVAIFFCIANVFFVLLPTDATAIKRKISILCVCSFARISICNVFVVYQLRVCMLKVYCLSTIRAKTTLQFFTFIFPNIGIGTLTLPILRCAV